MKAARFLIATCGIFVGSVVGHVFGSGSLQVGNAHFTFLLLIALAAAALSRESLEGPKLAMVIALAQFGTHFFFSTSGNAELKMAISHVIFGVLSYVAVVHLDQIFTSIANAFERLVLVVVRAIEPVVVAVINARAEVQIYLPRFFAQDIARRGPPVAN
mgnify:CR=1 FL=1